MSRKKKLMFLAGGCFAGIFIFAILDGFPWWKALLLIAGLLGGVGITGSFVLGMAAQKAEVLITEAIGFCDAGNFKAARLAILNAVRLDTNLLKNRDVQSLYELLAAAEDPERIRIEASRVKEASSGWPKSKMQQVYNSDTFFLLVIIFVVLLFLVKFVAI